jgi:hypothetical protein
VQLSVQDDAQSLEKPWFFSAEKKTEKNTQGLGRPTYTISYLF